MNQSSSKMAEIFLKKTSEANNIIITTHAFPDADGIGSQIALCLALRQIGKKVICINEEMLLERYRYLDPNDMIISHQEFESFKKIGRFNRNIDLLIVVDTNSVYRIGEKMQELAKTIPEDKILYIDHHPCAKNLMDSHCIDTSKAATGQLSGELISTLGIPFTFEMALPLYTAILIDTSSFRYPSVTGSTHRLIGSLMDSGVRPPHAYNMIYGTKKIPFMKLLGNVLASSQTTEDESIAWLTLTKKMLEQFETDTEDTHSFINNLLILDNIKVAVMFREVDTEIKVSLRSLGKTDVGMIARKLGGGGHDHSAATVLKGQMDEVIKETIKKIQEILLESE